MCHSRERCLRSIHCEKQSSLNELLENDGSVSIEEQNLQVLLSEMHKISDGLSRPLIKDISNKQKS